MVVTSGLSVFVTGEVTVVVWGVGVVVGTISAVVVVLWVIDAGGIRLFDFVFVFINSWDVEGNAELLKKTTDETKLLVWTHEFKKSINPITDGLQNWTFPIMFIQWTYP